MIIDHTQIRKIKGGFAWIDRQYLHSGWIYGCDAVEQLVYYWLILASNEQGVSFYRSEKAAGILQLNVQKMRDAQETLIRLGLIAKQENIIQVLELPQQPYELPTRKKIYEGVHGRDHLPAGSEKAILPTNRQETAAVAKNCLKQIYRSLSPKEKKSDTETGSVS
jgi:hypothetical protein